MLARIMREIPKLTDAVVGADVEGKPSYDITKTGRGETRHARPRATCEQPAREHTGARQAHCPTGTQGPGRCAGRRTDQGRRRLRGGSRDRAL